MNRSHRYNASMYCHYTIIALLQCVSKQLFTGTLEAIGTITHICHCYCNCIKINCNNSSIATRCINTIDRVSKQQVWFKCCLNSIRTMCLIPLSRFLQIAFTHSLRANSPTIHFWSPIVWKFSHKKNLSLNSLKSFNCFCICIDTVKHHCQ